MIWFGSNSYQTEPEPRPQPLRLRPRPDIGRRANVTSEAHEEKPARSSSEPGLCFMRAPKYLPFLKLVVLYYFFVSVAKTRSKLLAAKKSKFIF